MPPVAIEAIASIVYNLLVRCFYCLRLTFVYLMMRDFALRFNSVANIALSFPIEAYGLTTCYLLFQFMQNLSRPAHSDYLPAHCLYRLSSSKQLVVAQVFCRLPRTFCRLLCEHIFELVNRFVMRTPNQTIALTGCYDKI